TKCALRSQSGPSGPPSGVVRHLTVRVENRSSPNRQPAGARTIHRGLAPTMKTSPARSALGVRRLAARFPAPELARAEARFPLGQSGRLFRAPRRLRRKPISTILRPCSGENSVEAQRIGHNCLTSYLL